MIGFRLCFGFCLGGVGFSWLVDDDLSIGGCVSGWFVVRLLQILCICLVITYVVGFVWFLCGVGCCFGFDGYLVCGLGFGWFGVVLFCFGGLCLLVVVVLLCCDWFGCCFLGWFVGVFTWLCWLCFLDACVCWFVWCLCFGLGICLVGWVRGVMRGGWFVGLLLFTFGWFLVAI